MQIRSGQKQGFENVYVLRKKKGENKRLNREIGKYHYLELSRETISNFLFALFVKIVLNIL